MCVCVCPLEVHATLFPPVQLIPVLLRLRDFKLKYTKTSTLGNTLCSLPPSTLCDSWGQVLRPGSPSLEFWNSAS